MVALLTAVIREFGEYWSNFDMKSTALEGILLGKICMSKFV